jgi:Cd2+/Zn2+-exporting ATPase/Cu+-exporting ATPase
MKKHNLHQKRRDVIRIGLVALAALFSLLGFWRHFVSFDVIALAATVFGGYPIYKEALVNLLARRMNMELSMTVALLAALAVGEFFTANLIVLFVLAAELLEDLTVDRGRQAIKDLLDTLPRTATVRRNGSTVEIAATDIRVGDLIVVKPGGRVPVDGTVVGGNSFVDQSSITGESVPAEKLPGVKVFAGSVNLSGTVEVRTESVGEDTAYGRIINEVEKAERSKAPVQKIADRLSGYLVYFALACAVITFLLTGNIRATISVVIVAGACGIAAGTPLAILGAIGRAARLGSIIKGGIHLEALGSVDTVVLDKTGTLTLGSPTVRRVRACTDSSEEAVVQAAAIAERPSEHPLAQAILQKARDMALVLAEPNGFEYCPGKGIVSSSDGERIIAGSRSFLEEHQVETKSCLPEAGTSSEVLVARSGRLLGSLGFEDSLRPEAVSAVSALRNMGIRTVLLTGDVEAIATETGRQLKVDEVYAGLLPDQKMEKVQDLLAAGRKVAMVGDGINDALALSRADVGVAMGSGTEVARECSDIVLLGNNLLMFVQTLILARRCRKIIWFNFAGTVLVDCVGMGLAAVGLLNPLLAVLIHVGSELSFILNSARLLPTPSQR